MQEDLTPNSPDSEGRLRRLSCGRPLILVFCGSSSRLSFRFIARRVANRWTRSGFPACLQGVESDSVPSVMTVLMKVKTMMLLLTLK